MPLLSPLLQELLAAARLAQRPELADTLRALGLAGRALPLWGLAAVDAGRDHYAPHPDGRFALITGAFEHGELVDLVATSLATRAMRRRVGDAVLLGADRIEHARELGRPLPVFADAWSWLCGGCLGIVILDFSRVALLLRDVPALSVQTDALAVRLKQAFECPLPLPPMFVPSAKEFADVA
jgi:hypothetical protein